MSFAPRVSQLKHRSLLLAALMATLCASGVSAQAAVDPSLAGRTKGLKTAPVTVYEMADFQCPVCRRFAIETFPTLEKEYINTGKVRWIFINFPLTSIHPNAAAAAEFATCAAQQGRFWQTHDMLYSSQESWDALKDPSPYFMSLVPKLGIKQDLLTKCLQSGSAVEVVKDDADGALKTGANSTPSFYIEGGLLSGLWPVGVFRRVLDSVYQAKRSAGRSGH